MDLPRPVRPLLALGPRGLLLRLRAWAALAAASAAIRLLRFPTLQRTAARLSRPRVGGKGETAQEVLRAVDSAARFVPGATCLARSLAARTLLAREGHAARVLLGVARDPAGDLAAHAWIEGTAGGRGFLPVAVPDA